MKLIAFDGDETLWELLDGINLSDRTLVDLEGQPDFQYSPQTPGSLVAVRNDGVRFSIRPEARYVMEELHRRGVLVGVITYNHEGNARRILEAFGVLSLVDYIVGEWHSDKDLMMRRMLKEAEEDGYSIEPGEAMLVDDDPYRIYRGQYERMGAHFRCFGVDIHDLREVLDIIPSGAAGAETQEGAA